MADPRDQAAVKALAAAQESGNVIGLEAVTGKVVARQDIDDLLLNDKDCFNLFLLALRALQKGELKSDPMGYYQLSTIHGLPLLPWNKTKSTDFKTQTALNNTGFAGYCAHSTDRFPTWHRPYLAILEQSIYSQMVKIAKTWVPESERSSQITAAGRFRLPFWDYWKPRGGKVEFPGVRSDRGTTQFKYDFRIPDIFVAKKVMVRDFNNPTLVPIDNPLVAFNFPPEESAQVWVNSWSPTTVRYPDANKPVTAMNQALNMAREGWNTNYNNMVNDKVYEYYTDFGTNSFGGATRTTGSLENLHNNYHVYIGGASGTMSDPNVAAFDPVFWIHHCQIDRLLAIWQATHPNSWFRGAGTKDAELPLLPFTHTDTTTAKKQYWDSNAVRLTTKYGYSYPDLFDGQAPGTADSIRKRYLDNYRWASQKRLDLPSGIEITPVFQEAQVFKYDNDTRNFLLTESKRTGALDAAFAAAGTTQQTTTAARVSLVQPVTKPAAFASRTVASQAPLVEDRVLQSVVPSELKVAKPEELDESNVERTWFVENIVERLALDGTFTMYFFIGDVDDGDTSLYATEPTLAGITHNFAAPTNYCDNCGKQEEQGQKVSGTVVITPILKDYVSVNQLADLTPESVKPFLVKNLKWRILAPNHQVVDPRVVAGLAIGITSKVTDQETREVRYEEYNDVIQEIIQNSS